MSCVPLPDDHSAVHSVITANVPAKLRIVPPKLRMALVSLLVLAAGCSTHGGSGRKDGSGSGLENLSEADARRMHNQRFGEGSIPQAEGESFFRDVLFPFNSSELTEEARADIESNAKNLRQSSVPVTLEGHCDERGTSEYNLALGQRRAQAVLGYLVSLGIPSSRLSVISYGENIPLDPGSNEGAWARNRRVHFGLGANEPTGPVRSQPMSSPSRRRYQPLEGGAIDDQ